MAGPAADAPTAAADPAAAAAPAAPPCPKLVALRAAMADAGVDAYIVPTEDPHMVRSVLCVCVREKRRSK